MTEEEWQLESNPVRLLQRRSQKKYNRKLRLFACACCRRMLQRFPSDQCSHVVEVAERFADGLATEEERRKACRLVSGIPNGRRVPPQIPPTQLVAAAARAAAYSSDAAYDAAIEARRYAEMLVSDDGRFGLDDPAHAELVREIFGNFHPISCKRSWLTSDVSAIAESIYQCRAFDRMPILADALQDAGCKDEFVLGHCRQLDEHVRGCWAIDLLTGRK